VASDDATAESPVPAYTTAAAKRSRERASQVNLFIPLVFIPLVLYAVLATAAVGYLYIQKKASQPVSPFDRLPDVDGDNPGVKKGQPRTRLEYDRKFALQSLPKHLRVALGETIQIGDLEVTPVKVERTKVEVITEGAEEDPQPCPYESLKLQMKLKNVSEDCSFTPLDNYFDRKWRQGDNLPPPLTLLQADKEVFFGGPAGWEALDRRNRTKKREWLAGRKNVDPQGLLPGKSSEPEETYTATNGDDEKVQQFLFGLNKEGKQTSKAYEGSLLWRVHLRRGLVMHKGKEVSATAVIGVEFSSKDYSN